MSPRGRLGPLLLCLALLAGCSTTASDLPLPGSGVSGPSYELVATFTDALNLAQGAAVKRDGVTIGRVRAIEPDDFTARVRMDIEKDVPLAEGTTARLRATTPLGELFVDVDEQADEPGEPLADGAELQADDVSVAPTIEDTMSAASMLINGGGLGQIQTIVKEGNLAVGGREDVLRDSIRRMESTTRAVNEGQDDLDDALHSLADVAQVLDERQDVVDEALRDMAPAARVLRTNTDELASLLTAVDALGDTAVRVIRDSRDDLVQILAQSGPVFRQVNTTGDDLAEGLQTLIRFADLIDEAVPAEYLNTYLYFQTDLSVLGIDIDLRGLGALTGDPREGSGSGEAPSDGQDSGGEDSEGEGSGEEAPDLLGLDGLLGGPR
ncbi:MCE family protein [Aeromicrobium sp. CTD01-1L150]|uniref:MCE family protein n=1 Tax=Aeromicrobium sp. CTD01-1L150 TaxID=3341830 RepID=UPI0035C09759